MIWQNADTGAQLGFTLNFQKPSWFQDSQHALLNQPMNRFAAQIVAGAVGANEHASTPVLKDSDALPAGEYYSQDLPIRNSRRPATSSWRCAARTRKRSVSTTCAAARR